jgi:hypothetical protein
LIINKLSRNLLNFKGKFIPITETVVNKNSAKGQKLYYTLQNSYHSNFLNLRIEAMIIYNNSFIPKKHLKTFRKNSLTFLCKP